MSKVQKLIIKEIKLQALNMGYHDAGRLDGDGRKERKNGQPERRYFLGRRASE